MLEITVNYTEGEYKEALREKLAAMPNKLFHTLWPVGLFLLVLVLCSSYGVLSNGWAILLLIFLAFMTVPGILGDKFVVSLALWNARRSKKFESQYHFMFDSKGFSRRSSLGDSVVSWADVLRVEDYSGSLIINVKGGAIPIPKGQLKSDECRMILNFYKAGRSSKASA